TQCVITRVTGYVKRDVACYTFPAGKTRRNAEVAMNVNLPGIGPVNIPDPASTSGGTPAVSEPAAPAAPAPHPSSGGGLDMLKNLGSPLSHLWNDITHTVDKSVHDAGNAIDHAVNDAGKSISHAVNDGADHASLLAPDLVAKLPPRMQQMIHSLPNMGQI